MIWQHLPTLIARATHNRCRDIYYYEFYTNAGHVTDPHMQGQAPTVRGVSEKLHQNLAVIVLTKLLTILRLIAMNPVLLLAIKYGC